MFMILWRLNIRTFSNCVRFPLRLDHFSPRKCIHLIWFNFTFVHSLSILSSLNSSYTTQSMILLIHICSAFFPHSFPPDKISCTFIRSSATFNSGNDKNNIIWCESIFMEVMEFTSMKTKCSIATHQMILHLNKLLYLSTRFPFF